MLSFTVMSSCISLYLTCDSWNAIGFFFFSFHFFFSKSLTTFSKNLVWWFWKLWVKRRLSWGILSYSNWFWEPETLRILATLSHCWVGVQYQVFVVRQQRCCGQELGWTLRVKGIDSRGWLKETITGRLIRLQEIIMMSFIKGWNRDVCFSTKCSTSFYMLDIFVVPNNN